MALHFPDREVFTTSSAAYQYRPATPHETTPRVVIDVVIEGFPTEAMVDTGGIYLLCHPQLANQLSLDTSDAISSILSIPCGAQLEIPVDGGKNVLYTFCP